MLDFSSLALLAYISDAVSKHSDFGAKVHRAATQLFLTPRFETVLVYATANDVDRAKKSY